MNTSEYMRQIIADRDIARGRALTEEEKFDNLVAQLGTCDSDCESHDGNTTRCTCGAQAFRAKFGPGKHTR